LRKDNFIMSYLFYADLKNNILLHPDVVKLSPELGLLSKDEFLFVILAYDYNSIFRQFPERQGFLKLYGTYGKIINLKYLTRQSGPKDFK